MEKIDNNVNLDTDGGEDRLDEHNSPLETLKDSVYPKIRVILKKLLALSVLLGTLEMGINNSVVAGETKSVSAKDLSNDEKARADFDKAEKEFVILSEQLQKSSAVLDSKLNAVIDGFGLNDLDKEEQDIMHGKGDMAEKEKKIKDLRTAREKLRLDSNANDIASRQAEYEKRASELRDKVLSNASTNSALAQYLNDYTKYGTTIDDKDPTLQIKIYEGILNKFDLKQSSVQTQAVESAESVSDSEDVITEAERVVGDIGQMIQSIKAKMGRSKEAGE